MGSTPPPAVAGDMHEAESARATVPDAGVETVLEAARQNGTVVSEGIMAALQELVTSPLNLLLLGVSFYLLYRIYLDYFKKEEPRAPRPPPLPKLAKRDFTLQELRPYNGTATAPDGRVLIAVHGKVFDVTRGKSFYGPGGPYDVFAGRDGSRGLGTFALDAPANDNYDDLSDLTVDQMNQIKDWAAQFQEKYDLVGRLLKPGEVAHDYTLDEEETPEETTNVRSVTTSPKMSPDDKKNE